MKALIEGAVRNPTIVNVVMFGLLVAGGFVAKNIPRESFPKVELDLINVHVVWPGHTPEEVEEGIVLKVEEAVASIPGVDMITADASSSSGSVRLELKKGADRKQVLDDVRDAVDGIANFPTDIEPPSVKALTNRQDAIALVLYGEVHIDVLRDLAERVRDDLLDLGEVSQVEIQGLRKRELAVHVKPRTLQSLGLTLEDVRQAIRGTNVELNAGTLRTDTEDVAIKVGTRGYTAAELAALPLRSLGKQGELTLGDVAIVTEQDSEATYTMRYDGLRAVRIQIQKTDDEDVIQVVDAVKAFVDGLDEASLPPGVKAALWRDRTVILHQRIDLLVGNGLIGLLLIFLALWVFTRLKLSIWVAAGLPVAVLGSAMLIAPTGVTINMISLFGLLLVSGILVDDAIVVSENVYSHLEMGKTPTRAAIDGTMEVLPAVSASILTTIIAFTPFFYMGGRIGKFVQAIPVVVIACLIFSWIEALLILPPHLAHALKPIDKENPTRMAKVRMRFDAWVDFALRKPYAWILTQVLRLRWPMVAFALMLSLLTIGFVQGGFIKFVFFPNLDADDILVEYLLEPGAPEPINDAFATRVEVAAEQAHVALTEEQSGKLDVVRGRLTTVGGSQSEHGQVEVELLPGEERDASAADIAKLWKKNLGQTPEARWLTAGPRRRGPFGKPVHVDLLSKDQDDLEAAAEELKAILATYPGTYDISDDLVVGKRELVFVLTERGRASGLTVGALANQLRQGLFGGRAEVIQRGRDELEVWVRFPPGERASFGQLGDLRVRTMRGEEVTLRDVATWTEGRGLDTITRQDRRRKVTVSAAVDDTMGNAGDILDDLKSEVIPNLSRKYSDLKASFEGQTRQRRKMVEGFTKALPWAIFGMFCVLIIVFKSYAQAILVILMIPLGVIGAIVGHVIIDMPLTVLSMWGIVALGGILVNDSIVFVDAINRRLARGVDVLTAVHEAGVSRFRPILLTTLTTAAGLMPLILEQSRQAQFLIPMAASLAFGLLVGTIFTLGVLPAGFAVINDVRQAVSWLRTGYWPEAESLEPAVTRAKARLEEA